ncbi:hypothetical protein FOMG_19434 [Fusarium oxysporum f. sp. melonis 26406]|uniref:Uncharacterized protein n=1 Tax=Fusarium oxysporum f. sp. melonis 26406 TaxID=1089452 RepID=W9Z5A9_FUSOX|nr:hypothetical protein FOMG_19434 [Fusarium oxysporum f. sp. melonis 26406]
MPLTVPHANRSTKLFSRAWPMTQSKVATLGLLCSQIPKMACWLFRSHLAQHHDPKASSTLTEAHTLQL